MSEVTGYTQYEPYNFKSGDTLHAEEMNHIQAGITNIETQLIPKTIESVSIKPNRIADEVAYKQHFTWVVGGYTNNGYDSQLTTRICIGGTGGAVGYADKEFVITAKESYVFYGAYCTSEGIITQQWSSGSTTLRHYVVDADQYFVITVKRRDESEGDSEITDPYNCDLYDGIRFEPYLAYWEQELTSAEQTILQNKQYCNNGDAFIFVTDPHWHSDEGNSPYLIHRIRDDVGINKIICGGDYVKKQFGTVDGGIAEINDYFNTFDDSDIVFATIGNHDMNPTDNSSADGVWNYQIAYAAITARNEKVGVSDPVSGCSYMDNTSQKIRYIQFPYEANHTNAASGYSFELIQDKIYEWFKELDSSWRIVLISHQFWDGVVTDSLVSAVPTAQLNYAKLFLEMQSEPDTPTIVMWLVGHCHRDLYAKIRITGSVVEVVNQSDGKPENYFECGENEILVVSTTTDGATPMATPNYNDGEGHADYTMVKGTTSEQAFDVVQICDYTEPVENTSVNLQVNEIRITRIGAHCNVGENVAFNRTFRYYRKPNKNLSSAIYSAKTNTSISRERWIEGRWVKKDQQGTITYEQEVIMESGKTYYLRLDDFDNGLNVIGFRYQTADTGQPNVTLSAASLGVQQLTQNVTYKLTQCPANIKALGIYVGAANVINKTTVKLNIISQDIDNTYSFVAPVMSEVAESNIATGNLVMQGTNLYRATQAITEGEILVPNTNIMQTNIADQIKQTIYTNISTSASGINASSFGDSYFVKTGNLVWFYCHCNVTNASIQNTTLFTATGNLAGIKPNHNVQFVACCMANGSSTAQLWCSASDGVFTFVPKNSLQTGSYIFSGCYITA